MISDPDPDDNDDAALTPASPYDPAEMPEADLWFLPGPPGDAEPPWPVRAAADRAADWAAAEAAAGPQLLRAAEQLARLDERLAHHGAGALHHLVLGEVAALLRHDGHWLTPERIALYRMLRLAGGEEARLLGRADWAVRRLLGTIRPEADWAVFLAEHDRAGDAPGAAPWAPALPRAHALTRAAALFHHLHRDALADSAVLEPAVAAMCLGRNWRFLPLVSGGGRAMGGGSDPVRALSAWADGAAQGAAAALLQLDRLRAWHGRASETLADLSGRTPPALIGAFLKHPVLSVQMAATETGASAPACLRNITLFADRGLVRETTGQGRYRFWTIAGPGG